MSLLQIVARNVSGFLGRESQPIRRLRPLYQSLLGWSGRGKGIVWPINGVPYRVEPQCRHRLGQSYDAPVAEFLRERVKSGALCIDVGANVGVYVLQFGHWSAPTGRVVAFEPNPGALPWLSKHVEINGLTERTTIVPVAVGAESGSATLYAAEADGMSRLGEANKAISNHVREITVPVTTLDEYCKSHGLVPDWLFIDIEGFEIAALWGARELIQSRRGDLGIIVEMHPDVWNSANTTRACAETLLAELKLRPVALTGQADALSDHGLVHLEYL